MYFKVKCVAHISIYINQEALVETTLDYLSWDFCQSVCGSKTNTQTDVHARHKIAHSMHAIFCQRVYSYTHYTNFPNIACFCIAEWETLARYCENTSIALYVTGIY
jgi:hypothetical protein